MIIALLTTNKMGRADIAVLIWFPPFHFDSSYPESTAFTVRRKTVEGQGTAFSQAVGTANSAATLHHLSL